MDPLIIVLFLITCAVASAFTYFLGQKGRSSEAAQSDSIHRLGNEIQKEMGDLKNSVQLQMISMSKQMNEQLSQTGHLLQRSQGDYRDSLGQVQHRLGELQEATQSMMAIGKDIASLQDILRSPKLRGGLGELFLGELLRQILPADNFSLQYGFRDGSKVDAVIMLGQGMIPVDAKFPLENFQKMLNADEANAKAFRKEFHRDVKKHIDSIAAKYILPQEGTFDFAMMYIPAENVYYELIIKDDAETENLTEYAQKKKVIAVSPNSFYAYLQAIVRGLKGLRIEMSAQRILEGLAQLDTDLNKVAIDFDKLGSHLTNAQSSYERSYRGFDKLRSRIVALDSENPNKSLLSQSSEAE